MRLNTVVEEGPGKDEASCILMIAFFGADGVIVEKLVNVSD